MMEQRRVATQKFVGDVSRQWSVPTDCEALSPVFEQFFFEPVWTDAPEDVDCGTTDVSPTRIEMSANRTPNGAPALIQLEHPPGDDVHRLSVVEQLRLAKHNLRPVEII